MANNYRVLPVMGLEIGRQFRPPVSLDLPRYAPQCEAMRFREAYPGDKLFRLSADLYRLAFLILPSCLTPGKYATSRQTC